MEPQETDIGIPAVLYLLFYGKKFIMFSVVCSLVRKSRTANSAL